MAQKARKKITTVREHPLHVPISEKHPTGITLREFAPMTNSKKIKRPMSKNHLFSLNNWVITSLLTKR
jgi:hypothetical protein